MIRFQHLTSRKVPPVPWEEGENLPWDDPAFSQRMLEEHLSQEHDLASRNTQLIDEHVDWIEQVLLPRPSRVLDLACGPGLYLSRMARRGHSGLGIDFSPASIAHAEDLVGAGEPGVTFELGDIRSTTWGEGFDLAMLLFGQLNVFRRAEASKIVHRTARALRPGGHLLLELQRFEAVEEIGRDEPTWSTSDGGLFSPDPHLLLTESFWSPETRTTTQRFFVVEGDAEEVTRYAFSTEAYTEEELAGLLTEARFTDVEFYPSLTGEDRNDGLFVVVGTASD